MCSMQDELGGAERLLATGFKGKNKSNDNGKYRGLSTTRCALRSR
jgi:hypothetical protein